MFKQDFSDYACEGDSIICKVGGFDCRATIYRDDCNDKPDERCDGFWPSLDPKAAGYIGAKSKRSLQRAQEKAQSVMNAWLNDEWFYCGVAVVVSKNGIAVTGKYHNALWGIECNYPSKYKNSYLRTVANELLEEAIIDAEKQIEALTA